MANREDLAIIRAARAGQPQAQLALGKRYLSGGNGLPQSLKTAMHWLERAAHADQAEAWSLIGEYIPYELATQAADVVSFSAWYERAFEQGVAEAGLVFAKLVLTHPALQQIDGLHGKAIMMLEAAAHSGVAEAQWLLAQHDGQHDAGAGLDSSAGAGSGSEAGPEFKFGTGPSVQGWVEQAADGGIAQAQYLLADAAWDSGDRAAYLHRALPLARALHAQYAEQAAQMNAPSPALGQQLGADKLRLLSRCCEALVLVHGQSGADVDDDRQLNQQSNQQLIQQFWELAAYAGDEHAQFALGLWFARMQADGARSDLIAGSANYKKAVRWLTLAGEGGLADAWYALSRIFLKPEFSQRSLTDAQYYLERAAEMGHCTAQLECGTGAWRSRRDQPSNDVRAVYWLQKAAAQNNRDAIALLAKITDAPVSAQWAEQARGQLTRAIVNAYPFLAARIELAALFGLTQAEALLIDINEADQGHCLVVDIRAQYARSKRRLIPIGNTEQRAALHRIGRLFEDVDCSAGGMEGNYRQRLYRLKTVLPQAMPDADAEDEVELID